MKTNLKFLNYSFLKKSHIFRNEDFIELCRGYICLGAHLMDF